MKPRQSITLTGASGYIGQHLLKQLTDEYHVIALSKT
ncbi:NAD-dependent epimerase/dehydratase family protein [Paenibacillus sp. FSL L8-0470]